MRTPEYQLCAEACKAVKYGLHNVAEAIVQVIEQDAWREFTTPMGRLVRHESFDSFITTKQPDGLGTDVATVVRVCADRDYSRDAVDRALQRPPSIHSAVDIVNSTRRPAGNAAAAALRRLRKDRPDLHARVIDDADPMTPHAAMVEAGFRPHTFTVPFDPIKAAMTLRRKFTDDEIAELVKALEC